MAHEVICYFCNKKFDRDKYPSVLVKSRRYAHAECAAENGTVEQKAQAQAAIAEMGDEQKYLIALEQYIKELFNIEKISVRIYKQIKDYHEKNEYTYEGILKALKYFFEVKDNSIEKANGGIGIVPYTYDQAEKYYYSIWMARQTNEAKPIEQYTAPVERTIIIKQLKPAKRTTTRSLFSFLDETTED